MTDKAELRRLCKEKRSAVAEQNLKSEKAVKILLKSNQILNADTVLVYASIGSEMKTFQLIEKLLQLSKNVALPKSEDNGIMTFYQISSLKELIPGKYGIPEPSNVNNVPDITDKTVCIVPGLAFTENGRRLGYGGGYYDRFLCANPHIFKIGYTYEDLIIPDIPVMPHDLKVNAIVTEERMVLCSDE